MYPTCLSTIFFEVVCKQSFVQIKEIWNRSVIVIVLLTFYVFLSRYKLFVIMIVLVTGFQLKLFPFLVTQFCILVDGKLTPEAQTAMDAFMGYVLPNNGQVCCTFLSLFFTFSFKTCARFQLVIIADNNGSSIQMYICFKLDWCSLLYFPQKFWCYDIFLSSQMNGITSSEFYQQRICGATFD